MQRLARKRASQLVLYILFLVAVARALVMNPGASFGAWAGNLAPAALIGAILLLWMAGEFPLRLSDWTIPIRTLDRRELVIGAVVLLVLGPAATFVVMQYSGLTYVLSFVLAGMGVLGACLLIATDKPAWGLVAFAISMPIVHFLEFDFFRNMFWEVSAQGPFFVTPTVLILWLIGFISLLRQAVRKREFTFALPMAKVWLLMVITMVVSAAFSGDRLTSFRSVTYLLTIAIPYFIVVNGIKTTEEIRLCCLVLGLSGAMRVLSILYFQIFKTVEGISGRFSYYGGYTIIDAFVWGLPFGFFLLFGGAFSVRSKGLRMLLLGLSATLLALAVPVYARSGIIAGLGGGGVFLVPRRTRSWVLLGGVITIVVLSVWWPVLFGKTPLSRFQEFSSLESLLASQRMRLDGMRSALLMIRDYPLVGIGPGMWEEYIPRYTQESFFITDDLGVVSRIYISGSHNTFLDGWVSSGVGGLVSQIILYVVMVRQSIGLYRKQRHSPLAELAMAFVAFAIMMVVGSVISGGSLTVCEPTMFMEAHYMLWFLFGLLDAWRNLSGEDKPRANLAVTV